jgi:hypothetical protein
MVREKSHFAHGQIHQAKRVKREKVRGFDDDLDLGIMSNSSSRTTTASPAGIWCRWSGASWSRDRASLAA